MEAVPRRRLAAALSTALVVVQLGIPARASNDGGFPQQWNLHAIGAEKAWETGTGAGRTIAVVDTGVDLQHADLQGKLLPGRNFVDEGSPAQDAHGHGTHVAGIAAALTDNRAGVAGTAPDARILPVKVLRGSGQETGDNIPIGIKWAVDNGATVVNVSLSIYRGASVGGGFIGVPVSGQELANAVRYAWARGVICVIAAGNDDGFVSTFSNEPALVVGATDKADNRASYSSKVGAAKWGMVAPGGSGAEGQEHATENVLSTWLGNAYAWAAGTSMAAPHVAAAAAILRERGLNPQQTVDKLLATAKDLGASGADTVYGHGRLDLAKAVAGLPPAPKAGGAGPGSTPTTRSGNPPTTIARSDGSTSLSTVAPTSPPTSATTVEGAAPATVPTDSDGPGEDAQAPGGRRDEDDGLPAGPPLVATALLAAVVAGLRRARRV